ncbi:MAG: hypothetical protein AAF570_02750 [Bacteroidota bacterium]
MIAFPMISAAQSLSPTALNANGPVSPEALAYKLSVGMSGFDGMQGTVTYRLKIKELKASNAGALDQLLSLQPAVMAIEGNPSAASVKVVLNRVDMTKSQAQEMIANHLIYTDKKHGGAIGTN